MIQRLFVPLVYTRNIRIENQRAEKGEQENDNEIATVSAAVKNLHNRPMSSIPICICNSLSNQSKVCKICEQPSPVEFDSIFYSCCADCADTISIST